MDPIVKLLLFSVIMLVAPVSAYFAASRGDLDGLLVPIVGADYLKRQRAIVSGALAVIVVNLVTLVYVVLAFMETTEPPPPPPKKEL